MINPMIVEGQVHGGVAQGIAAALYERLAYDDQAEPLSGTFADLLVPPPARSAHRDPAPGDALDAFGDRG